MSRKASPLPITLGDQTLVAQYLQALEKKVAPCVPEPEQAAFREETLEHLDRLIEDGVGRGMSLREATMSAIAEYGDATEIADSFVQGWYEAEVRSRLTRRFGFLRIATFACFAVPQCLCVLLLLTRLYLPSTAAIPKLASPAQLRQLFSFVGSVPDLSPSFAVFVSVAILAPVIGGAVAGYRHPVGAAQRSAMVVFLLATYSFFLGLWVLPSKEVLQFSLFQFLFWLPLGALAAHTSSLWARRRCTRPTPEQRSLSQRSRAYPCIELPQSEVEKASPLSNSSS